MEDDYIKKVWHDPIEGIEVMDFLRESLVLEESEKYEAFSEADRKELLFRIFKLVALGGSLCQYEDYLTEYREAAKFIYKSMVTVKKDKTTGSLFLDTHAFELNSMDGKPLFTKEHLQNQVLLAVNPSSRVVNVLLNKWTEYW